MTADEQMYGQEILNSLIKPLKDIQTNDEELIFMKTITFFDPRKHNYVQIM